MANRQTDEEKIVAWFSAADPEAVKVMFRVLKGIVTSRGVETGRAKKAKARTIRRPAQSNLNPLPPDPSADTSAVK